jgi:hypothetical protein
MGRRPWVLQSMMYQVQCRGLPLGTAPTPLATNRSFHKKIFKGFIDWSAPLLHERKQSKLSSTMQTTPLIHLLKTCVRSESRSKSLQRSHPVSGPLSMTSRNQQKALLSDISRHLAITAQLPLPEIPQSRSSYHISSQQSKTSSGKFSKAPMIKTSCGGLRKRATSKPFVPLEACVLTTISIHSKRPVWHGYMTPTSIVKDITSTKISFLQTKTMLQLSKNKSTRDPRSTVKVGEVG